MYVPAGRIERQSIQRDKAPAALSMRRYRYDAAGQLTQIEDSRKGATDYRYDPVGRLIEAIAPGLRERFAFDPASNIVDPGRPENARTQAGLAARSESTLPVSVPKVLGNLLREYAGTHFDYDAQGHLIQKRSPAGTQRYEWDAFDRMQAAQVDEGERRSASSYYYDALGRRIAREVNGARTVFGWDGDTLAYESDEARSTHYVYEARTFVPMAQYVTAPVEGIETPVAREGDRYRPEDDPLQRVPVAQGDARVMFYYCDQIGTPLMMTDEAGEVVWEAAYKAWGETREVIERASAASGGAVARNALRFQGQQVDDETGLHYNLHRYYDPESSRFTSRDPIKLEGGSNLYQYAPKSTQWVDPLGLAKVCCCGEPYVDPDARWRDVMNDPNTPSSMRGWLQNQARRVDAGQQVNIKAPPGYELAHRPRFENDSGYDYSHADPMLAADHRGIQHRYWRKRNGCWSAKMPSSGSPGTGKLSLPKTGSLP